MIFTRTILTLYAAARSVDNALVFASLHSECKCDVQEIIGDPDGVEKYPKSVICYAKSTP